MHLGCFIRTKFGKIDSNRLKSAVVDFYPGEEVIAAKARLFSDVDNLELNGMPALIRRRNGESRVIRECDDILELIIALDERTLLDRLPRYASDYSDHFPSPHFAMRLLFRKLDTMQAEISNLRKMVQMYQTSDKPGSI